MLGDAKTSMSKYRRFHVDKRYRINDIGYRYWVVLLNVHSWPICAASGTDHFTYQGSDIAAKKSWFDIFKNCMMVQQCQV